jgi:hypothetical protein
MLACPYALYPFYTRFAISPSSLILYTSMRIPIDAVFIAEIGQRETESDNASL